MRKEQRKHYRLVPESAFDVTILEGGHEAIPGHVQDISANGVGVRFAKPGGPALLIGRTLELRFTCSSPNPIVVSARVRQRNETSDSCSYGFGFTHMGQLRELLMTELSRTFNQRGMFRVPPTRDGDAETLLQHGNAESVRAQVISISGTGMACALPAAEDATFLRSDRLKVVLTLPACPEALHLEAHIRTRCFMNDIQLRYGIAFDLQATANAGQRQDLVIQYVTRRQREILRASAA